MKIRAIVCDDEPGANNIIKRGIGKLEISEIEIIGEFMDGCEAIDFCRTAKPDLAILDIEMPYISGIDVAKNLKEFLPDIEIIFITAHPKFKNQSINLYAADYIEKPMNLIRFEETLKRVIRKISAFKIIETLEARNKTIELKSNHETFYINPDSIIFIERMARKSIVHTLSKSIDTYESLEYFQSILNQEKFIRIHSGYLVNIQFVEKVCKRVGNTQQVLLKNCDKQVFVSRRNVPILYKYLDNIKPKAI